MPRKERRRRGLPPTNPTARRTSSILPQAKVYLHSNSVALHWDLFDFDWPLNRPAVPPHILHPGRAALCRRVRRPAPAFGVSLTSNTDLARPARQARPASAHIPRGRPRRPGPVSQSVDQSTAVAWTSGGWRRTQRHASPVGAARFGATATLLATAATKSHPSVRTDSAPA